MTAVSTNYGVPATYAVAASLAAGNYDLTGTSYNSTANKPLDVAFEYVATVAANSSGNRQVVLFVQASMDGATWPPLPISTTDTSHDTSMRFLGFIATNGGGSSEGASAVFSVAAAFAGLLPPFWRVVAKNDCGVALSGCSARTREIGLSAA